MGNSYPVIRSRDMARFSVAGDEGEGSSSPRRKRPRFTIRCNYADDRLHSPQPHEDGDPPVDDSYVDIEGDGSGDEILESEPVHFGDVDDEEEEEGEDNEDDGFHDGDGELHTVQDQDNDGVVVGSLIKTNNQPRVGGGVGGQGQVRRLDGGCSTAPSGVSAPDGLGPTSLIAPVSVILGDPEVLDCFICCEPLSAPVFQCENGHIACSSCCRLLHNKCPTCSMPIGYNRCRALEKVLESIKMVCQNEKYGCKELLSYGKKNEHENACKYMTCSCPHSGCKYTASSFALSMHLGSKHSWNIYMFQYNKTFHISVSVACRTFVLQGEEDNVLFIVNKNVDRMGSIVTLGCIGPHISKEGYQYVLMAKSENGLLSLQSSTKAMQGQTSCVPSTVFLLIPNDFYGTRQHMDLRVCISSVGILRGIGQ